MIYGILKNPAENERDTSSVKLKAIFRQVTPASLLSISADIFQRALVDESGMIRTQMGKSNRSEMVAVLGTHCAMPCCIHTDRPNHSQSHSISHTHKQLLKCCQLWISYHTHNFDLKLGDRETNDVGF
jgi:hypothetical protein